MKLPPKFGGFVGRGKLSFLLSGALFVASYAHSENVSKFEQVSDVSSTRFIIETGWTKVQIQGAAPISGPVAELGLVFGFNEKLGLKGSLIQTFAAKNSFSSLYTAMEVGGTYAILGTLRTERSVTFFGGVPVVRAQSNVANTLRISALANQFFLNGSNKVIGLAGVGSELAYDYIVNENWGITSSLSIALASNGTTIIIPLQFRVGGFLILNK